MKGMTKLKLFALSFISLLLATVAYFAVAYSKNHVSEVDLNNVKVCIGCHGPHGNVVANGAPVLAGKDRDYLLMQLKAIQKGQRETEFMIGILDNYTERQLLESAHYFSKLPKAENKEKYLYCDGCHTAGNNVSRFDVEDPH